METNAKRSVGRPRKGNMGPPKSSDAADARWTVRGVPMHLRKLANAAADEAGVTVGDWLSEAVVAYARPVASGDLTEAATALGGASAALTYWGPTRDDVAPADDSANDAQPLEIIAEWFDVEDAPHAERPAWTKRGADRDFGWVIEDIHRRLVRVETRRPASLGAIFRRRP
jgi:hypothetical protein